MIKAIRLTMSNNASFEDVRILMPNEQKSKGIRNYFEDSQVVFMSKRNQGKQDTFVLPMYRVAQLLMNKSRTSLPADRCTKFSQLCLSGDIIHENVYVLHPGKRHLLDLGIPLVYRPYDQFTFVTLEGLHITNDFHVVLMKK